MLRARADAFARPTPLHWIEVTCDESTANGSDRPHTGRSILVKADTQLIRSTGDCGKLGCVDRESKKLNAYERPILFANEPRNIHVTHVPRLVCYLSPCRSHSRSHHICTFDTNPSPTATAKGSRPNCTNPQRSYSDWAPTFPCVTVSCTSLVPRRRVASASASRTRPRPTPWCRCSDGTYIPNSVALCLALSRLSNESPATPTRILAWNAPIISSNASGASLNRACHQDIGSAERSETLDVNALGYSSYASSISCRYAAPSAGISRRIFTALRC